MTILVRLSSKGQLVIPSSVRRALRLSPGAEFRLEVANRKIILDPIEATSPIDALLGRFAGQDLLGDLEQEHWREIENEQAIRPSRADTAFRASKRRSSGFSSLTASSLCAVANRAPCRSRWLT
jgi:AbrB family looped-hinge helix DNA binding protein